MASGTRVRPGWRRALLGLGLGLALLVAQAAPEQLPLYTAYLDSPLDGRSAGNLTQKLADWLSERSAGRYRFQASQLPRTELNALLAKPDWRGAVAWANPRWFGDAERQRFLWTRAFMQDADLLVSTRSRPIAYLNEGRSLEGLRVGSVAGHHLQDLGWMIERGLVRRVDAPREFDLLTALKAGRVDAALVQAISIPHLRRRLAGLDDWLYIAPQPRDTYWRHLFVAPGQTDLQTFLDQQLARLPSDPAWRGLLPQPPRQLRLLAVDRLDSPYAQALRRLLDAAFERAGLRYALDALPAERGFVELRAGRYDGDIVRHEDFNAQLPGLLRVEPAHSRILQLALARPGGPRLRNWDDLRELTVAVPRGIKVAEELSRHVRKRQLVEGADACVRMVESGRVQVCLLPGFNLAERTGREAGRGLEVQVIGSTAMHLWLRAGLDDEARRLGAALTALQREGELDRLLAPYRAPRLP